MSAVYRALLGEGDRYLEEAQGHLAGPVKDPANATAHAALAQALYARAALEKPDLLSKLAAMKPPNVGAPTPDANPASAADDPVVTSMNRHPAGKKRAPRKAAQRNATPGGAK